MLTAVFRDGDVFTWYCTAEGGRMERTSDYHTSVYVGGESTAFTDLREQLAVDLKIVTTTYKQWRTDLREREPSTDLRVDLERIDDV